MKVLETLVCINTDEYYLGTLTYGKLYQGYWESKMVYSSDGVYWEITNDIGVKSEYHESKFITLEKWRQEKLNKILK
jgi:hypothetical protein